MCWACEYYGGSSLARANPETVVQEWGLTDDMVLRLAREQRANLTHSRIGLCDEHFENYERVVEVLEERASEIGGE